MTDIVTKKCSKCGEIKPISYFHRYSKAPDGYSYWCRQCKGSKNDLPVLKERRHIAAQTKICSECKRELDKSNFSRREQCVDGMCSYCHECERERQYRSYHREPERFKANVLRYETKNPERKIAWRKVHLALLSGKMQRPAHCQECGTQSNRIEAHHWHGYDDEHVLDVQWLCRSCHKKAG